jgi:antitoxin component HigA of HigAB toxin-antitoxin module
MGQKMYIEPTDGEKLIKKAESLEAQQRLQVELFAIQVKIEDYLNTNVESDDTVTVGDFLRIYLDKLSIKQNKLAEYIGMKPSNFSKILSGSRKVNFELSFILSRIFKLDPKVN